MVLEYRCDRPHHNDICGVFARAQVAILFTCEVDNIAYFSGIGEKVRARVEEAGRVDLSIQEAAILGRIKTVNLVCLVLGLGFNRYGFFDGGLLVPALGCVLAPNLLVAVTATFGDSPVGSVASAGGGADETPATTSGSAKAKGQATCTVIGSWLLGTIILGVMAGLSVSAVFTADTADKLSETP